MGRIKPYPPVKLIAAITLSAPDLWDTVQKLLVSRYAEIDHESEWYQFVHTDHYESEMGPGLRKRMVSFKELILAEQLPLVKLATNEMEQEFSTGGQRRANIDPGYVCLPRLVLATTKDFNHRIYLGQGIFGDLHLEFRAGRFQAREWTYPDYREPFVLRFFEEVRQTYIAQRAALP